MTQKTNKPKGHKATAITAPLRPFSALVYQEKKKKETVLQKNTLHLLGNRRHDRNNEVRVKRKNQKNLFKN